MPNHTKNSPSVHGTVGEIHVSGQPMAEGQTFWRLLSPYCIERTNTGWVALNREYKPVGITLHLWCDYNDPGVTIRTKGLQPATLKKLDVHGKGEGDVIYLYDDGCPPWADRASRDRYLERFAILMETKVAVERG